MTCSFRGTTKAAEVIPCQTNGCVCRWLTSSVKRSSKVEASVQRAATSGENTSICTSDSHSGAVWTHCWRGPGRWGGSIFYSAFVSKYFHQQRQQHRQWRAGKRVRVEYFFGLFCQLLSFVVFMVNTSLQHLGNPREIRESGTPGKPLRSAGFR